MTQIELIAEAMKRDVEMLKRTLEDFSDADMVVRPTPGANHAAWQVGHLVNAESRLVNGAQAGAVPPPPAGYPEKFNKETAKVDDPAFFPKKAELLDALAKGRGATIAWLQTLQPADLDRKLPESLSRFAPTIGVLFSMVPMHVSMHMGQIQVIRRKLGKPHLM